MTWLELCDVVPEMAARIEYDSICRLERNRWPEGVRCPKCGGGSTFRLTTRRVRQCSYCEYQFSVRIGTVMQNSKLPAWQWLMAARLLDRGKITVQELGTRIGVSYKTAWLLRKRINEQPALFR